jgi:hypothetical protein
MSDISRVVMEALRKQLRDLEFDAVLIRGRTEQLRDTIDWLENGERPRGRPRGKAAVIEMPDRVAGAQHEPETQETAA